MFALIMVFCLRKSETLRILLSNLNRSASIQVEPKKRLVLSSFALAGPIYLPLGSALDMSVSGSCSHGPLRGM